MITKEELMEAIKQVVREEVVREVVKKDMEILLGKENFGIDYLRAMVKEVVQKEIWEERNEIRDKKEERDARQRL